MSSSLRRTDILILTHSLQASSVGLLVISPLLRISEQSYLQKEGNSIPLLPFHLILISLKAILVVCKWAAADAKLRGALVALCDSECQLLPSVAKRAVTEV